MADAQPADPVLQPIAYGHPAVAFFHVFFKVCCTSQLSELQIFQSTGGSFSFSSSRSFQVSSFLVYLLCGLFSSNFIANFVAVVVLLMFDFWTVSSVLVRPHLISSESHQPKTIWYPCNGLADQKHLRPAPGRPTILE